MAIVLVKIRKKKIDRLYHQRRKQGKGGDDRRDLAIFSFNWTNWTYQTSNSLFAKEYEFL